MNTHLIAKLLGRILFLLGVAFLGCALIAWWNPLGNDTQKSLIGFLASAMVSVFGGGVLVFYGTRGKGNNNLFRREALAIIGLSWVLASFIGALPYLLIAPDTGFANAFFESTSGLTTTGASIFSDPENLPFSLLFWRSLSQWIGGMGVVVLFVAILSSLGAGGKILYSNESSGAHRNFESERIERGVLRLLNLYLLLSAACFLAYFLGGMSFSDALCHMFTTLSTGGFSTKTAGFAHFNSPLLEWMAIVFMILGGTSFFFLLNLFRKNAKHALEDTEVKAYLGIFLGATLLIGAILFLHDHVVSPHDALRHAAFQVSSIMTTTGFASDDFNLWSSAPKLILLILMVVGGCSGSTAGGAKVSRIVVGVKVAWLSLEKAYRARIIRPLRFHGKTIDDSDIQQVTVFLLVTGLILLLSIPLLAVTEPDMSVEGVISSVFACLFNIGPGFGEVGPTQNFGFLSGPAKVFLSFLMIAGRLELFAFIVLFFPKFWKKG